MKKSFCLIVLFLYIFQMSSVVFADSTVEKNCFVGCDFEDAGDFVYGTGTYSENIIGIENNSVVATWPQHAYIMGYAPESHAGAKALHIKNVNPYYPVTFKADLDRGALYKVSAWVKAANGEPKMNWAVTTQDWEWSEGEDVYISNDGNFDNMYKAESIWGNFANNVVSVTGNEWTKIERILYVAESGSNSAISVWIGLASYQSGFEYYIDDVVLEKIEIHGAGVITIPQDGIIRVGYNLAGADILENQEITLKEAYPGVSIENGVLSVTNEANEGTIVLCMKKSLNGEEKVMAQYNVDLQKEDMDSFENIFWGGNFEEDGNFVYANNKIIGIENNSVIATWPQHAYILGYAPESHGGNKALHIKNVNPYYPVSFRAELQRGYAYKVSAWVKAVGGEPKMNWAVTTKDWEWSGGDDVYISDDGNFDNMYRAESIWGDFANNVVSVNDDGWTKIEKILYVTESDSNNTISTWIGLASYQSGFEYYIDDVSIVKQEKKITINEGYETVYVIPGENRKYTYTASCFYCGADDITWGMEGDTFGVSMDNFGNLTVLDGASGEVTIKAEAYIGDGSIQLVQQKKIRIVDAFIPEVSINIDKIKYGSFSPRYENYNISYYGEKIPDTDVSGEYAIDVERKENIDFITVQSGVRKKIYELCFQKRNYADNLYQYGNFEDGVIDDSKVYCTGRESILKIESNDVHDGEYSLWADLKKNAKICMKSRLESGKMYVISMWVKSGSSAEGDMLFEGFDTDDETIDVLYYSENEERFCPGKYTGSSNTKELIKLRNDWQKIDRIIRIEGEPGKNVTVNFGPVAASSDVEVLIDDIFVYESEFAESNGVFCGTAYKNSSGELTNIPSDAHTAEIYIYNPNAKAVEVMANVAGYKKGILCTAQGQTITITSPVGVIRYTLNMNTAVDEYKIFLWNHKQIPYIASKNLK